MAQLSGYIRKVQNVTNDARSVKIWNYTKTVNHKTLVYTGNITFRIALFNIGHFIHILSVGEKTALWSRDFYDQCLQHKYLFRYFFIDN